VNPAIVAGAVAVLVAVAIVVLPRVWITYPAVFRRGDVVLASNDPYYYRYWVDQLLGGSLRAIDPTALASLPEKARRSEVLLIVGLWWLSALAEVGSLGAGDVLAWYPVFAGVLTAIGVGMLTYQLTRDSVLAIAAIVVLGLTTTHIDRTLLAFADHHALDTLVLVATAIAVTAVARVDTAGTRRGLLAATGLGLAITTQVAAWDNGHFLLLPIGAYVLLGSLTALARSESPLAGTTPLLAGLAIATVFTAGLHLLLGWFGLVRTLAPGGLLLGAIGVIGITAGGHRRGRGPGFVTGLIALLGLLVGVVGVVTVPALGDEVGGLYMFFVTTGSRHIGETVSLLETAPISGWFFAFGVMFYLALPTAWVLTRRALARGRNEWYPVVAYGGFFFLLTLLLQQRFSLHLTPFVAVFASLGIGHLGARLTDVADPLTRLSGADTDRGPRNVGWVAVVVLLLAIITIPGVVAIPEYQEVDTVGHDVALTMDGAANDAGIPDSEAYVLSQWDRNRQYNYFVNGDSLSYVRAREQFLPFMESTNRSARYDAINRSTLCRGSDVRPPANPFTPKPITRPHCSPPVGFVVVETPGNVRGRDSATVSGTASKVAQRTGDPSVLPVETTYVRLALHRGSRARNVSGLGRFRLLDVHRESGGERLAFAHVRGARVVGEGPKNATLSLRHTVDLQNATFTYRRVTRTTDSGEYSITVPYPGRYDLGWRKSRLHDRNTSVEVTDVAVADGGVVRVTPGE
jgi:dolichyl-diphosphooligosaccharide--protein glycosyltransferase